MPRVFLNYRREDSEGIAGRIFDRLRERFGPENVFRDLDTIAPGAEFASVIGKEIAKPAWDVPTLGGASVATDGLRKLSPSYTRYTRY